MTPRTATPDSRAGRLLGSAAELAAEVQDRVVGGLGLLLSRHQTPSSPSRTCSSSGAAGCSPSPRAAARAGRTGMLRAGLVCLEALAASFGAEAVMPREELLGIVLPTALVEHDLLRTPTPSS